MNRKIISIFIAGVLICACPVCGQARESLETPELVSLGENGSGQFLFFSQPSGAEPFLEEVKESVQNKTVTLYSTANVNIREHPDQEAEVLDVLAFNTKFQGYRFSEDWYVGEFGGTRGFLCADYVSSRRVSASRHGAPENTIKSFMSYRAITAKSSPQYKLQKEYSYTGDYGVRQVKGRYCAALGSGYTTKVGQYFDLILKNGTCIPCILADQKANKDTDSSHKVTGDGSLAEFVVDTDSISGEIWHSGDIGSACAEWDSPVKAVKIYEKNVFED